MRPRAPSHLLVGGQDQLQLAALRAPAGAGEVDGRRDLRRDLALHVLGSAPEDLPVDDLARPGVEAPLVGVGRHGVDVAEQAERLPGRLAGQAGDQVRVIGLGGQQRAFEARLAQARRQQILRRSLVAGRVDRVEADQLGEQLDRVGSQPAAGDRRLLRHPVRVLGTDRRAILRLMTGRLFDAEGSTDRGRRTAVPESEVPLAVRMRPRSLDELVGQDHLLGAGLDPANRGRDRRAALDGPLRATGLRQDDPGADRRRRGSRGRSRRSPPSTQAGPRCGR